MSNSNLTVEKMTKALQEANGIVSKASKKLGCTRQRLSQLIKESEELQAVRDEAREEILDLAEENVLTGLQKETKNPFNNNYQLSRWVLGTLGKNRGYAERKELTGEDGGAVEITLKRKVVK